MDNRKCIVIASTIYLLRFCRSCSILSSRISLSHKVLLAVPRIAWVLRNRRQAIHNRIKLTSSPGSAISLQCSQQYMVPSCTVRAQPNVLSHDLKAEFRLVGVPTQLPTPAVPTEEPRRVVACHFVVINFLCVYIYDFSYLDLVLCALYYPFS